MKYYQLSINDNEDLWTKYKIFDIDFIVGNERVDSASLYSNSSDVLPVIKTIVDGMSPDFSMVGTNDIIMRKKSFDRHQFSHPEISFVPIKNGMTGEKYFLLKFEVSVECVDLNLSSYEKWPEGEVLTTLHNHIGRHFFTPVLCAEKIPDNLDAFKLKNWGGAFNIVISENLKKELQLIDNTEFFLIFTELQVV